MPVWAEIAVEIILKTYGRTGGFLGSAGEAPGGSLWKILAVRSGPGIDLEYDLE